jgi:hypothetical protein
MIEEDFDDFFFKDFANYSEQEWQALVQKMDPSDHTGDVDMAASKMTDSGAKVLAAIFKSDSEKAELERLREKLSEKALEAHLNLMLQKLSTASEINLNMVADHHLEAKDVADIKQKSEEEVAQDLKDSKARIRASFAARYKDIVM